MVQAAWKKPIIVVQPTWVLWMTNGRSCGKLGITTLHFSVGNSWFGLATSRTEYWYGKLFGELVIQLRPPPCAVQSAVLPPKENLRVFQFFFKFKRQSDFHCYNKSEHFFFNFWLHICANSFLSQFFFVTGVENGTFFSLWPRPRKLSTRWPVLTETCLLWGGRYFEQKVDNVCAIIKSRRHR